MSQRINTLRRKTTNRNDTNQMRAVSAAPLGLKKCVSMLNPGLAPWAMQEYRPYRALLRPHQLLAYFDALVLAVSLIKCLLIGVWAVECFGVVSYYLVSL